MLIDTAGRILTTAACNDVKRHCDDEDQTLDHILERDITPNRFMPFVRADDQCPNDGVGHSPIPPLTDTPPM